MTRVTLCSIFRNSAHYLDRYFAQVDALREHIGVRLVGTWGDSTDDTHELLAARDDLNLGTYHHGGPDYGSVDHLMRWEQIAKVVRFTLDRVGDPGDALIWVESDLTWRPAAMLKLLDDLGRVPAVAPMVFAIDGNLSFVDRFYDTWGFRQNGQMFNANPPFHHQGADPETGLVKIDSCGSCWVSRGDAWKDWSGHWPYEAGGDLWLDPTVRVRHP